MIFFDLWEKVAKERGERERKREIIIVTCVYRDKVYVSDAKYYFSEGYLNQFFQELFKAETFNPYTNKFLKKGKIISKK